MKTDTCWVTDVAPGIWPFLWALHSQTLEWICWDIHVWEDCHIVLTQSWKL